MRMALVLGALGVILSGCAHSSGVMDTGGGTYSIAAQASPLRGGPEGVAHDEAVGFCGQSGKHAVVLGIDKPILGGPKAELHFRCD